jgi:hypothetical protein
MTYHTSGRNAKAGIILKLHHLAGDLEVAGYPTTVELS